MERQVNLYSSVKLSLKTKNRFTKGELCQKKHSFHGRPVPYSELSKIHAHRAWKKPIVPSVNPIMYLHFYGIRGNDQRIIPNKYFSKLHLTNDEIYTLGLNRWRLDLTVYNKTLLPGNELNRSKGHVNNNAVELFQGLFGKVRIYIETESANKVYGYYCDLNPGEFMFIPKHWYHSTHVLEGPSGVIDIVNQEGFVDWRFKKYKTKQSHCTFIKTDKTISCLTRSDKRKSLILQQIKPNTTIPHLRKCSSLYEIIHKLSDRELIQFAKKMLNTGQKSLVLKK